jgi:hypothetical protein
MYYIALNIRKRPFILTQVHHCQLWIYLAVPALAADAQRSLSEAFCKHSLQRQML